MPGKDSLVFGLWLRKPLHIAAVAPSRARFLQMTNAFASPLAIAELGIAGDLVARVRRNLPPSQVWACTALPDATVPGTA